LLEGLLQTLQSQVLRLFVHGLVFQALEKLGADVKGRGFVGILISMMHPSLYADIAC